MRYNKEEYFAQLEMLVNIDSGFDSIVGTTRIIDFFENGLKGLKFNIKRVSGHGLHPDYLIATNKLVDRFDVMLVGHVDTAFEKGIPHRSPYRTDGINAYGPGIADMKAGTLAIYHMLKCAPPDLLDRLSLCVFINGDEEIFLPFSETSMISYARKSEKVFVYESAFPDGSHCLQRKGRLRYHLEFLGIPVHSGYVFETRNASAILEMSQWIQALNSMASRERGISFNAGVACGGTAVNMVPSRAELQFEFRMWDAFEQKSLEEHITYMMNHPFIEGASVRILDYLSKPPMTPSKRTLEYVEHVKRLFEDKMDCDFTVRPRGGMSDANHIFKFAPICIDGLGPRGELNTSDSDYESVNMESVEECINKSLLLLEDIVNSNRK